MAEKYSFVIEVDNRDEALEQLEGAIDTALTAIGEEVVRNAKKNCPVDTGLLRNSLTYALGGKSPETTTYANDSGTQSGNYSGTAPNEKAVFVGSNVEYAVYQEVGNSSHKTGHSPYLKPAVMEHTDEYKELAKKALTGDWGV